MSMLTKNLSLTSSTGFSTMDTIFKAVMSDDSKIQKNVIIKKHIGCWSVIGASS